MLARLVACFIFLVLAELPARGQTVSPVISEYVNSADGSFQVRNEGQTPITVILEVRSFTVDRNGNPVYRDLDRSINVQLSAKSFRVLPHRPYAVFYRAHADHLPAWFTIYANFQGRPSAPGLHLLIRLPHTVYLLTKSSLARSDVVVSQGQFDPAARKVTFLVENRSAQFDRAQSIELRSLSSRKSFPGFPSFPGQARLVTLDWDGPFPPNQVEIVFSKFKYQSLFPSLGSGP